MTSKAFAYVGGAIAIVVGVAGVVGVGAGCYYYKRAKAARTSDEIQADIAKLDKELAKAMDKLYELDREQFNSWDRKRFTRQELYFQQQNARVGNEAEKRRQYQYHFDKKLEILNDVRRLIDRAGEWPPEIPLKELNLGDPAQV